MTALRVGLSGLAAGIDARLRELDTGSSVLLVVHPDEAARVRCHLVVGAGPCEDDAVRAAADVWLDDAGAVDTLWRDRILPFARNLVTQQRAPRARRARIADPDPTWPAQARRLVGRLAAAVGDRAMRIDHIGSTSVPGLPAKDLIDLQVVVADHDTAPGVADAARAAGFVRVRVPELLWCADRNGIPHPEEIVVDADPGRPVNVNVRAATEPVWRETLLFRDWLRADGGARAEYLTVKRELAARPDRDVDDYGRDKIPWIAAAAGRAEAWATSVGWTP